LNAGSGGCRWGNWKKKEKGTATFTSALERKGLVDADGIRKEEQRGREKVGGRGKAGKGHVRKSFHGKMRFELTVHYLSVEN